MQSSGLLLVLVASARVGFACEKGLAGCNESIDGGLDDVIFLQTTLLKTRAKSELDRQNLSTASDGARRKLSTHSDAVIKTPRSHSNAGSQRLSSSSTEICQDLENHGSYFSARVEVGMPKQAFDLVADTGSNSLIVPDCRCVLAGACNMLQPCFDTIRSGSYALNTTESGLVPLVTLSFGSGDIDCIIASDYVNVGPAQAYMKDGIFLTESSLALEVDSSFQGILGMGLPESDLGALLNHEFMVEAGISRFSLCFNGNIPGTLRMNMPPLENPMTNIGRIHWGLDLQGMSVGSSSAPVLFCDPSNKMSFMESACGAIPDSGTTLMEGPTEQINVLFAELCDAWPRCSRMEEESGGMLKRDVFLQLISDCADWLDESDEGIYEVPSVMVHLAGAEGVKQIAELTAWSWVVETDLPMLEQYKERNAFTDRRGHSRRGNFIQKTTSDYYCMPMFASQDYVTDVNGPVWILGSPLFYDNTVSFDIGVSPVAIGIRPGPCYGCQPSLLASSDKKKPLLSSDDKKKPPSRLAGGVRRLARPLRRLTSFRSSSINRSRGF
mmetsp:Transcript_64578/g.114880  ORF Transcript_64578/g.114880 Transcript_64578/m.114880 type:complete len:554 (-) Transcript_64578:158-1819(-)